MERVFVSSTCWDLTDIRAELEHELRNQGLTPVLSDSATSDFIPDATRDSIASCLQNLATCQHAVFIFDHRYGPILSKEKTGYDNLSATHLEYLEAERLNIPRRVYARDRLLGDMSNFRATDGNKDCLRWVSNADRDIRLFDLIETHRRLMKDGSKNWIETFQNSVHLKDLIRRDFRLISARANLERQLKEHALPSLIIEGPVRPSGWSHGQPNNVNLDVYAHHRDVYEVEVMFGDQIVVQQGQMAVGQRRPIRGTVEYPLPRGTGKLKSKYFTFDGHRINDEWELILFDWNQTCSLVSRKLTPGTRGFIEIV